MSYLVVWSTEGPIRQTEVDIGDNDPVQMTNGAWVVQAAVAEGYSLDAATELLEGGFDLILVCDYPNSFYGSPA